MDKEIFENHIQEILNGFQDKYKMVVAHVFVFHSNDHRIDKISIDAEPIEQWKGKYGGKL
jgi:hypothetical protein